MQQLGQILAWVGDGLRIIKFLFAVFSLSIYLLCLCITTRQIGVKFGISTRVGWEMILK